MIVIYMDYKSIPKEELISAIKNIEAISKQDVIVLPKGTHCLLDCSKSELFEIKNNFNKKIDEAINKF